MEKEKKTLNMNAGQLEDIVSDRQSRAKRNHEELKDGEEKQPPAKMQKPDSSSSDSSSDEEPAKKQEAKVPKSSVTPKSVPKAPVQPKKVALEPKKVGKDSSSSKHQLNVDLYLKPSEKKPPISDVKSSATEEENHSDTTFESEISESKRANSPFRRVKAEETDASPWIKSYSSKIPEWGRKASDALKHTQGKSFRHEKTKKKRGTYIAGAMGTAGANSYFFPSDDE